jgi:hypothetical protein
MQRDRWRKDNLKKLAAQQARYYKRHPGKQQERKRQRLYGLTPEAFNSLLASQGNKCAICQNVFTAAISPHVDHDHVCCPGKKTCGNCIRGLLCGHCNRMLGGARDIAVNLSRGAEYLIHWRGKSKSANMG